MSRPSHVSQPGQRTSSHLAAFAAQWALLALVSFHIPTSCAWSTGYRLPSDSRLNGGQTLQLLDGVKQRILASSVTVLNGRKSPVCMGTIVTSDGFIATKGTELDVKRTIYVRLPNGGTHDAFLVGYDKENDLAVLKIQTQGLQPIRWKSGPSPTPADWVVSYDQTQDEIRVGVIGARKRKIERSGGVIGVELTPSTDGVPGALIRKVVEGGAALENGIRAGDRIVSVNRRRVEDVEEAQRSIAAHDPGERIEIGILRDGDEQTHTIQLRNRSMVFDLIDRNQRMSGKTSKRRAGFQEVVQHDAPLDPRSMGAPVFTITGEAVGLNIARSDRVTNFALTPNVVQAAVNRILRNPS
ncbi:MAG: PDZ domain-containing protein [Verrucomicrobiota bacterium]